LELWWFRSRNYLMIDVSFHYYSYLVENNSSQLWQKLCPNNLLITHRKVCERLCTQQKSAISKCWIIIAAVYNISCISYCHIAKSLSPSPNLPTFMALGLHCIRSGVYSVLQSCMRKHCPSYRTWKVKKAGHIGT
jgi:hypothetical protein